MANICNNQYKFVFGNEEQAKKFFDFIEGDVYCLGVTIKINKAKERDVREWIDDKEISKNIVFVYTESKWTPCPNAWRDIARTFDEGVEVCYEAEEPGCEIFASNDPDFVGKYVYDFWNAPKELEECHYEDTGIVDQEQLVKMLQAVLHTKARRLVSLMLLMAEKGLADDFSIHQIKYYSTEDWGE